MLIFRYPHLPRSEQIFANTWHSARTIAFRSVSKCCVVTHKCGTESAYLRITPAPVQGQEFESDNADADGRALASCCYLRPMTPRAYHYSSRMTAIVPYCRLSKCYLLLQ